MSATEVIRIKDVIIEKISANDAELAHIFGYTERQAAERRREMQKLPSQQNALRDGGMLVTITGFDEYLQYRNTPAWKKEMDKMKKIG
ncbi:TPA: hypothetical protein ACGO8N_000214 [Streptococcus suis]|uniref:hypothetical protein n=1 Tax=Streptococcus suis TaxID=1307 RepID=UPI000C19E171|nr:hypothetical protein [Streptococcus suis]MDG3327342.1 hypothetical protein [Streptococcus suis]